MQGDYFVYNPQMFPQAAATCTPYGCTAPQYSQNVMPSHRTIDKLKVRKPHKSLSVSRQYDEFGSHSTDESIHLVRSRKGENSRYENNQNMLKKRSQSGTSIMKGMASQLSVPRSQSDERSISPSLIQEKNRKNRKDMKKSMKNNKSYSKYDDEDNFTYSQDNRLIDPGYLMESNPQAIYQQQQQMQLQAAQNAQYYQSQYPQYQSQYPQYHQTQYPQAYQAMQGYSSAPPGAPVDYYNQSNHTNTTQNFNQSSQNPSQSYYQQADAFSATQTFGHDQQQPQQTLPNGAKIVAEYFLGYLDDKQQQQYYQQQQQQQQQQIQSQQFYQQQQQTPQYQAQQYDQQQACPTGCVPVAAAPNCPPGCVPEGDYQSEDSPQEEVDIEIWEKPKKEKRSKSKKSFDDFKKLSSIIDALEKKLGNMKTDNHNSDPIQPIFLMPKQTEQAQAKPIYIPRNIYVPVIRPVFVPRERIIVRPQIIHVARPVLVDRPVPIQQRPLVIERDRPVPVRVETIERTEGAPFDCPEGETQKEQGFTETTFHEFSQNSFQKSPSNGDLNHQETSSNFNYNINEDNDNEQTNKNKQLVLDLLEEADRRKKSLESNDSFVNINNSSSKNLDNMPYNSGYTLEVLDQRVSDKFEKVDQETIKARYGVDSFQYLPSNSDSVNNDYQQPTLRSSGGSYKSLASNGNENVSNTSAYGNYVSVSGGAESQASVYAQNYQTTSSNGNLSSILTDLAKMTSANK